MKFIHAADLHVDSPLVGLEKYDGVPLERMRRATRESLENLVTLATRERVDFVVVAGDLFDGQWPDMNTGLWTANQFRRLEREDIPVYLLRGNHDAASKVAHAVSWPSNVFRFHPDGAKTFRIESLGVALHGLGFAEQAVEEDLAKGYPEALPGLFNIGVLHTSLAGSPLHDRYAPTSEAVLKSKGYAYWALGHVHERATICRDPLIAYPGNSQGRHVREPGAKGCLLVTVEDGHVRESEFHATDAVRWHFAEIVLAMDDHREQLYRAVRRQLESCHTTCDGRFAAVRIVISGASALHHTLVTKAGREELTAEIRNLANEFGEAVWVEKVQFETAAPVDLEKLRQGSDLMGDLLRTIEELAGDDDQLAKLAQELDTLGDHCAKELKEAGIDLADPDQLRRWLKASEGLLVSQLWETDA